MNKFRIAITTIAICCISATVVQAQIQNPDNGHYYQAISISNGINWYDANSAASAQTYAGVHGHLATITSAQENSFILNNLPRMHDWWLGGYQPTGSAEPAGGWRWITDEAWVYTNWNSIQPDNCGGTEDGLAWWADGSWNDGTRTMSSGSLGYIVEFEPVPEPASIITLICGCLGGCLAYRRKV